MGHDLGSSLFASSLHFFEKNNAKNKRFQVDADGFLWRPFFIQNFSELSGCCIVSNELPEKPDAVLGLLSCRRLTLSPPNKLSSATFLVCFNFQSASLSLKVGERVV